MVNEELLADLRSGARRLDALNAFEFEDLVAALVVEKLNQHKENVDVMTDRRDIVDIILEYKDNDPISGGSHCHFIEVKNSSGNLPFEKISKAYCAALRYVPNSLTLATHDGLQPQAIEYAHELFSRRGSHTRIKLMRVAQTLRDRDGWSLVSGPETSCESRQPLVAVLSWELWKETTFTAERIASSDRYPPLLALDHDAKFSLRLFCSLSVPDFDMVTIDVNTPEFELVEGSQYGDQARIDLGLTVGHGGEPLEQILLTFHHASRSDTKRIRLPRLEFGFSHAVLPELRAKFTDTWANRIAEADGPKLLFVRGEAGIGKTTFCERISHRLKQSRGYECTHLAIDDALEDTLFYRIFAALALPYDARISVLEKTHQQLAQALLEQTADSEDSEQAETDAMRTLLGGGDPALYLDPIGRFIASLGIPQVLVLTNCQHLSPPMVLALRGFFAVLETHGWANLRILCEFRDTVDERNPDLEEAARKTIGERLGNATQVRLEPFREPELAQSIISAFPNNNANWIAGALIEKTGGNPLFLENLLQHFLGMGHIKPLLSSYGETKTFRVTEGVHFEDRLNDAPTDIGTLLEQRIAHIDGRIPARPGGELLATRLLGLAALQGSEVLPHTAAAIGLSVEDWSELTHILTQANLLTQNLGSGQPAFNHDLVRLAARRRFQAQPSVRRDCDALLARISASEPTVGALVPADIHLFLGNLRAARAEYERVHELASQEPENFILKRRSLCGLDEIFTQARSQQEWDSLTHLNVLANLGWAEHNAGSAKYASEVFERALEMTRSPAFGHAHLTPEVIALQRSRFSQSLFGETVYSLELNKGPAFAREALLNVPNLTEWGRILNRLILFCHMSELPVEGYDAAHLAVEYADRSEDPEVLAVLCTDIGDMFLLANPAYSLTLREAGVSFASSGRQKIHNDLCLLVSNFYAHGAFDESAIPPLEACARDFGVHEVLARLSLLKGMIAYNEGHLELARSHFLHAHQQAVLRGHWLMEVMADNNLMITTALLGYDAETAHRANSVFEFCATVERETAQAGPHIPKIIGLARMRAQQLDQRATRVALRVKPFPLPCRVPRFTSWLVVFKHNLGCLPRAITAHHRQSEPSIPITQNQTIMALATAANRYTADLESGTAVFTVK